MLKYQRVSPGPPPFADAVFRRLHDHFGGIGDICHDVREDDPVAHEQNNGDKCRFDVPSVSEKKKLHCICVWICIDFQLDVDISCIDINVHIYM